ncbi:MAG TPA: bacteriohopanetetrol glucosamine biosynthesis glycosyltransferase HpnI [Acidobacteriaceae bacterium]|nr:bacteriohopanetetrol glucosamine biosynthesis glycosyltransferase HpnI [Acidobacteriaceae bacterium]
MDWIVAVVQGVVAVLTLCGVAYGLIALWSARDFERASRGGSAGGGGAVGVSILKPVKGLDARMYAGLVSHCVQEYAGEFELLFGVSSLEDAAVGEVARLRVEFPAVSIRLVECTERLGASGKMSNLVQMLPEARFEHVIVNDSDIRVSPKYLERVMAGFANESVGLVTVPYVGWAEGGLWSRLEALGISTDFMPGVLVARKLEGGIRFGLGSTLATTKTALAAIGGFEGMVDQLADDYELGARLSAAGYKVALVREVVETTVPAYTLRGFCEHQLRWARSTRDSRQWGYVGLGVTYVLPWSMAAMVASGFALWSFSLFSIALLVRVSVALTVGVGILRDGQVLRDIVWLPLRDCFGLFFWAWSYAGDEIVWRGERFRLRRGVLEKQKGRV